MLLDLFGDRSRRGCFFSFKALPCFSSDGSATTSDFKGLASVDNSLVERFFRCNISGFFFSTSLFFILRSPSFNAPPHDCFPCTFDPLLSCVELRVLKEIFVWEGGLSDMVLVYILFFLSCLEVSASALTNNFKLPVFERHLGHCHFPGGARLRGGSRHSKWYVRGQLSQHSKLPPRSHSTHS
uniref:Uncharacterized protein n=1 Tax=Arundo donax TaxID=35708 RepID=A0A0A9D5J8_ARUDO